MLCILILILIFNYFIKSIKANNTAVQEKRILAITIVANTFFTIQFMLQGAVAAIIIYLWHINQNIDFLNSYSYYWFLNILPHLLLLLLLSIL